LSTLKPRLLVLFCITFCLQYFFSQTKVYDVKETTLHLQDSIVYLRSTMSPVTGIIQKLEKDSRRVVFEASFINGKKSGPMKLYGSGSGEGIQSFQLVFSGNYLNGIPHGLFEWFYSTGKIMARCNYINGKLNGKCQGWYEEHGQLKFEENYQLGRLFGVLRYFSQDGVSLGGGDLINGTGKLVLYYRPNNVAVEAFYDLELSDSVRRIFFEKGLLKRDNDFITRSIKIWDREGRIKSIYSNHFHTDSTVTFFPNGEINSQSINIIENDGIRTQEKIWYSNRVLAIDELLLNGNLLCSKYRDENNLEIFSRPFIDWKRGRVDMIEILGDVFDFEQLPGIWTELLNIGSSSDFDLNQMIFEY
jgi:antitoxin component YwqK of YwqJK toxin-antitoxin module